MAKGKLKVEETRRGKNTNGIFEFRSKKSVMNVITENYRMVQKPQNFIYRFYRSIDKFRQSFANFKVVVPKLWIFEASCPVLMHHSAIVSISGDY